MPLGEAVKAFTRATRCPDSIDVQKVANAQATDVPTHPVEGRFTPANGLRRMLWSSPLKLRTIKDGYRSTWTDTPMPEEPALPVGINQ